jgi:hypothetical protein
MPAHTILMGVSFLSFVLATAQAPIPRVNLIGLGLAFWSLAVLLGGS